MALRESFEIPEGEADAPFYINLSREHLHWRQMQVFRESPRILVFGPPTFVLFVSFVVS